LACPDETSKPRLALGCRWAAPDDNGRMLLFPEGAIRLQGTGLDILACCDGARTLKDIAAELSARYSGADPGHILKEAAAFLDQLHHKRIVDF